ncbi:Glycosyl hydrolase catalytic core [Posidoniimonas polymericola]|uniref:Glycosyl hydrolase catalytic core n=1 Tax=Posidoniimonas polymericola TaxID=2528002 RepID=A0A5C5ZE16_9BACT|nr:LamG-like jellyroll fold domain-containing protein [Posidoniimonas polymericola]TWT85408.1 Glycosyl hydrolase catalytic core [Posidoniimonas polymericola]
MTQRRRPPLSNGSGRRLSFESLEGRAMLSLTHLYTFNDGTADDSVGTAHGTLVNGAAVLDQKLALQNSGVTSGDSANVQYVQLPANLLTTADATIEFWFQAGQSENWTRVFDFGNKVGGAGDSYLFYSQQSGAGDSRATLHPSSVAETVASSSTTDDGAPHQVAVVMDAANGAFRLHVDGQLVSSVPMGRGSNGLSINDTLNFLGRSLFDADPGFTGLIDEVRIYDHALTAGEITVSAAEGPAVVPLPGDYDRSGVVDAADRVVWVTNYGSESNLEADGNGDGRVDAADYAVWRDNLGLGEPTPPSQVLEDESLTVPSLSRSIIELTGRSELHLTSATNPLTAEVRLNSPDAWLFFENVKPTEVMSDYLMNVRVNGAAAFAGINVRVVQHGVGTVVIPQDYRFVPLEVFTGPQFTGDSAELDVYTYYNTPATLGVLQQNASSFVLKRGYMATIASDANARYSQVYVAQDHDLEIALLPEQFDNQVRFIRVLPWRWVAKKGASDIGPETLDASWFYNWNNSEDSTLDYEYVPIRQQRWWPAYPTNKEEVTHLLGYNEPNNPVEDAYTSLGNGSVDTAIAVWPELLQSGLRVGSPAVTDGGKAWLYEFMDKAIAADLRVDYIAIHNYQAGQSAASLKSWLQDVYDRYHLPIWITEFNNGANWTGGADPTYAQNAQWVADITEMMDTTPWIERYSIYSRVEAVREMTYSDGSLTPAGQVYHNNDSPIGYVQEIPANHPTSGRSIASYAFDDDAHDQSGYGYNGYVAGVPRYATDPTQGQVIDLGGDSHVQLPEGVASGDGFTFAGWVNWDGGGNWQRIFDFGNDTSSYMFLTPSNGSSMRFAIKDGGGEQTVQTATLPVDQWTHVAVTLGGGSAKLYVNGALVATNNSLTITPSDFAPTNNYLGKSQFTNDPLLNGQLNDVLVTDYALTATQIAGLMANTPPVFAAAEVNLGPAPIDTPFSGSLAGLATDADPGDSVTYAKANGPAWLTVAANGALSGTPTDPGLATQEFVVAATDSRGAVSYTVVTIPLQGAVGRGPVLAFSADEQADAPQAIIDAPIAAAAQVDLNLLLTLDHLDATDDAWASLAEPVAAGAEIDEAAQADLNAAQFDGAFASL